MYPRTLLYILTPIPNPGYSIALCRHNLGDLPGALAGLTEILVSDPLFVDALISRGNVYIDYRLPAYVLLARRDYCRVLRLNPVCIPGYVNLALSLQLDGNLQQAWMLLSTALGIAPYDTTVYP